MILPADNKILGQSQRPEGLQIQISHLTVTNIHLPNSDSSLEHLNDALETIQPPANEHVLDDRGGGGGRLFDKNHEFPCKPEDLLPIDPLFKSYLNKTLNPYYDKNVGNILAHGHLATGDSVTVAGPECDYKMSTDSLKRVQEYDLWCVVIEQFWMEFVGVPSSRNRPVPFIESFPIKLWLSLPAPKSSLSNTSMSKYTNDIQSHPTSNNFNHTDSHDGRLVDMLTYSINCDSMDISNEHVRADMYILICITHEIVVELDHYQYLFLMRLMETITSKKEEMVQDTELIMGSCKTMNITTPSPTMCVALCIKEVEFSIIAPPTTELSPTELTLSSPESVDINIVADHAVKGLVSKSEQKTQTTQCTEIYSTLGKINYIS